MITPSNKQKVRENEKENNRPLNFFLSNTKQPRCKTPKPDTKSYFEDRDTTPSKKKLKVSPIGKKKNSRAKKLKKPANDEHSNSTNNFLDGNNHKYLNPNIENENTSSCSLMHIKVDFINSQNVKSSSARDLFLD